MSVKATRPDVSMVSSWFRNEHSACSKLIPPSSQRLQRRDGGGGPQSRRGKPQSKHSQLSDHGMSPSFPGVFPPPPSWAPPPLTGGELEPIVCRHHAGSLVNGIPDDGDDSAEQ